MNTKIVQIFDQTAPYVSGYSMRSRYITDSLHQLNVPLKVFSSPIFEYANKEEVIAGVPYSRITMNGLRLLRRIPVLKEALIIDTIADALDAAWENDFGVIDAHSSVLNGLAALQVARRRKVPFLYEIRALWEDAAVDQGKTTEGSLRYNLTRRLETKVIKSADKVTVICEGLKKDLLQRGIPEEKITVIPNGVDTTSFQQLPPQQDLINKYNLRDCKVLGFIGTFFRFEGLDILIRGAKNILKNRKDVRFLLVGGGREENNLKRLAKELELEDKVIFTGRIPHEEIQKYYSLIDIFIYPRISKRITELVTPLKPLEAMALRKIVIASNVGGLKELVKDNDNGLLFQADDSAQLAEKCLYVLDHFEQMKQLGENARRYVEKERNWVTICQKYLELFMEITK